MDASDTALHGQNTTAPDRLYLAFELGEKSWKLSLGDGRRAPSRCTAAAGDTAAVLFAVSNARTLCHIGADVSLYGCSEAGRDRFWLHRWLVKALLADHASHFGVFGRYLRRNTTG
jgi:transposase